MIVGNGVAGTTAALNIRRSDPDGLITIISDEPYPFYSRVRLPELLSGGVAAEALLVRKDPWYRELGLELLKDTVVHDINISGHSISTTSQSVHTYDRLLIASGSISFVPPVSGAGLKGVFTLRTMSDALAIRDYLAGGSRRVVLIGGGVLGLEAGHHMLKAGHKVTVIESLPRLLPRQMDSDGARMLKKQLEALGFQFVIGMQTKEIKGGDRANAVILSDASVHECDMALISAGVRPNIGLAAKAGLSVERGIVVDDRMETSAPGVFAAGDVVQHQGICYGIWPAAERQGEVAGINMGGGSEAYHGTTVSNLLKVAGISIFSAGDIDPDGNKESAIDIDSDRFIYRKLVFDGDYLGGAILYNDLNDRMRIFRAVSEKRDISGVKKQLVKWDLSAL